MYAFIKGYETGRMEGCLNYFQYVDMNLVCAKYLCNFIVLDMIIMFKLIKSLICGKKVLCLQSTLN